MSRPSQPIDDDQARFPRTILPTACLPWTEDGRLDGDLFMELVAARLANGIRHLYVFGTAGEVAKNAAQYEGKKVKLSGIYAQGFSNGGRPSDPWALVIKDKPADKDSVACIIPAKVDIKGSYPKITAEGTLEVEKSGAKRIKLNNCTYKIDG